MKEIVQQELIALAEKIIRNANQLNASALQQEARLLYEKAVVLEYLTANQPPKVEPTSQSATISPKTNEIKGFGVAARQSSSFLQEPKTIQKTENTQPIFPPVSEIVQKPQQPTLEDILAQVPKEQPVFEQKNPSKETHQRTLNDVVSNKIQFGLNDRIAFISHLFEGNERDFAEAITALNSLPSEQEAIRFIQQKIKPVFNNWVGKEEYEERFVEVVSKRFS